VDNGNASPETDAVRDAPLDRLAQDLQELRAAAGSPSYAEVASRISRERAQSATGTHAHVGKTTVYDVFRLGRRRVDIGLALEIVRALGCDDATVAEWQARYVDALRGPVAAEHPLRRASDEPAEQPADAKPGVITLLLLGCVALNLAAHQLVVIGDLPIYLDMVGTAVAAIAVGPWRGAAVGVATNGAFALYFGHDQIWFGLVQVAGALLWGYGVRRFGMGRTIGRYFVLNVVVAVVCSVVAVPIIHFVFGDDADQLVNAESSLQTMLHNTLVALSGANLLSSLADKLIGGFIAIALLPVLPVRSRSDSALRLT